MTITRFGSASANEEIPPELKVGEKGGGAVVYDATAW
jgi:hypothetical protein